jgi:hypothetical protein
MRDLKHVNDYQQLLLSALALVHEEDLVAIFRALRKHPQRGKCIDLLNAELDKGISLMDAFAEPSKLHELFTNDWPELRVLVNDNTVFLKFGTNGPPSEIQTWRALMSATGVVAKVDHDGRYYPEGVPDTRNGPKGHNPLDGLLG